MDAGKIDRLINALEDYFEDNNVHLSLGPDGNETDEEIENVYKELSGPLVAQRNGVKLDQWISVHSEAEVSDHLVLLLTVTHIII